MLMHAVQGVLLLAVGFTAGTLGAIAGIGGGLIVIPVLALYFGIPMHQAIGVSLVAVIATSTATSSVHVERHVTDIRLGMTLELATTLGAVLAAVIAGYVHRRTLALLFSGFLIYTGSALVRRAWTSRRLRPEPDIPDYSVRRYPLGMAAGFLAGGISGLLGVGGGAVKVPVMYLFMGVPLRVATATSNFMIGVTASASAFIYWQRGDVIVAIAAPIVVGVFAGSLAGARLAPRLRTAIVLGILVFITYYLALQMLLRVASGKLT
jgi:uncharacterized membrane protein YfcA